MLLPCAATCPSVVARAAAVGRGAIAGERAAVQLGGQLCGDSGTGWQPRRSVYRQVRYLSVRGESQGDVRAVSHLSVVQDLRDVAGDRSFKHVYISPP